MERLDQAAIALFFAATAKRDTMQLAVYPAQNSLSRKSGLRTGAGPNDAPDGS